MPRVYIWHSILISIATVILAYFVYTSLRPTPRSADIFVIGPPLEYGETTLVGTLRKDVPVGEEGTFLLILSDGRPISLDSQGLDNLLGSHVRVEGYLSPGSDGSQGATMAVSSLTLDTL